MATWGRTTDIEFIYGLTDPAAGTDAREEIQAAGHKWIAFNGPREGSHPILWVATENNMVADHGADDLIRFAPAPELVSLDHTSRESVMDAIPGCMPSRQPRWCASTASIRRRRRAPAASSIRGATRRSKRAARSRTRRSRSISACAGRTARWSGIRPTPTRASASRAAAASAAARRSPTAPRSRRSPACASAPTRAPRVPARRRLRRAPSSSRR